MKRLTLQVVAATLLVALLAACSNPGSGGMTVRLDPVGNLGYEVSGGTLTVETRSLVFRNAPGEPLAVIDRVQADFFDSNGVLVESWVSDPNSLSIVVPAGFTCNEPDPVSGCTMFSEGARAGYGMPSSAEEGQVQLLPHAVAMAHMEATMDPVTGATISGNATWWGEFTFHGSNAHGEFEFMRTFYITAPN